MDAGGLAQMSYNNFHQNSAPSFGSRGKGSHLRNISVGMGTNNLGLPSENQPVQTPRSARSALLAGLRTAPKSSNQTPTSAPSEQSYDNSRYAGITAPSMNYGQSQAIQSQQRLPTPPTVVPSPSIQVNDGEIDDFDQETYQQMQIIMAQNAYFAHVQQQIAAAQKVQQLQHQLAQLQMQSNSGYSATPPMSPGIYNSSGIYSQFNPFQQQQQQQQQQYVQNLGYSTYSQNLLASHQQQAQSNSVNQVEVSSPIVIENQLSAGLSMSAHRADSRSRSPPKLNLHQSNPSIGAIRRGHRKTSSLSNSTIMTHADLIEGPKTSLPKLPSTPLTATFGPGHASGNHPIRQPRGPPSIEELKAKPTSKDDGSKNFATRWRRRAVNKLFIACIDRRAARSNASGTTSVGGTMTPVSENETFGFETESVGSSFGGESRQSLRDSEINTSSSDEGSVSSRPSARGNFRAPSQVLSAAEKRKSALF